MTASNMVFVENSTVTTHHLRQSQEVINNFIQGAPFTNVQQDPTTVLFTSNSPVTEYAPDADITFTARITGVDVLYDTYHKQNNIVLLLDSEDMKKEQQKIIGTGETSVFNNEIPHTILVPQVTFNRFTRQYIKRCNDLILSMKNSTAGSSQLIMYFKGTNLQGSLAYKDLGTPNSLNNQMGVQNGDSNQPNT